MVDVQKVQERIYYGYAKCAEKIGLPFQIYRSPTPIDPLSDQYKDGIVRATTTVGWDYMKYQTYGKAVWTIMAEARANQSPHIQVGDYLVETSITNSFIDRYQNFVVDQEQQNFVFANYGEEIPSIYFIASKQSLMPLQAVKCNRIVSLVRPSQTTGKGGVGYAGRTLATDILIARGMPASILEVKATASEVDLKTEAKSPNWIILLPNLGNVSFRANDIFEDDLQQQYCVNDNELTELGWRLTASQVINAR